jgi:hypothetical protein
MIETRYFGVGSGLSAVTGPTDAELDKAISVIDDLLDRENSQRVNDYLAVLSDLCRALRGARGRCPR